MKVLGISGSPIKNSNTDRAVKRVLKATGLETEFIICAVRPHPSGRGYKALFYVFSFRKIAPETISPSAVLHTAE